MSRLTELLHKAATAHHPVAPSARAHKPSSPRLLWTPEQERVLAATAPRLLVSALAGSGKSTLVMEYARRRPHQSWRFLAFNKSVVHALTPMAPKNVTVHTAHQMAFGRFGAPLAHKLEVARSPKDLCALLKHPPTPAHARYAATVLEGLTTWCHSSSDHINLSHRNPASWATLQKLHGDISWSDDVWLRDLHNVWAWSVDPKHPWGIDHDVYLKRWCMKPDHWPGTHFMLDEAQDWSEAFLSAWDKCAEVSVRTGDPFQRLYEWRGASATAWVRPNEHELWLTQSFRTGLGMEKLVNDHLQALECTHHWRPAPHLCSLEFLPQTADQLRSFAPNVVLAGQWTALEAVAPLLNDAGYSVVWADPDRPPFGPSDAPPVVLSTIHAAKGLEWGRVWVADGAWPAHESPQQRHRLAYVAATRARHACRWPAPPPEQPIRAPEQTAFL